MITYDLLPPKKPMLIKIMSAVKGIAYLHLNRYNIIHNLVESDGKENTYSAIDKSQE